MVEYICFPLNPSEAETRPSNCLKLYSAANPTTAPSIESVIAQHRTCNITKIDCVNINLLEHDIQKTVPHLLPYVIQEDFTQITVRDENVCAIKGKCHEFLAKILCEALGEKLNVCDICINTKYVLNTDRYVNKIVGSNESYVSPELNETIKVLKALKTYPHLPPLLLEAFTKATKYLRGRKRARLFRRDAKVDVSDVAPTQSTTNPDHNAVKRLKHRKYDASFVQTYLKKPTDTFPACDIRSKKDKSTTKTSTESGEITFKRCYTNDCKVILSKTKAQDASSASLQYPKMCIQCAEFNFQKRHQRSDLSGRIAVVTGGRIKIGYQVVLKLLRDGCSVITTTRFPKDAAKRYAKEDDFKRWASRLYIYPLDLKDIYGTFYNYQDNENPLNVLIDRYE